MKKIITVSLIFGILLGYLTYYLTTGDLFPFSHGEGIGVTFVLHILMLSGFCGMGLLIADALSPKKQ